MNKQRVLKPAKVLRINVLKLPKKIGAIATNGMTILKAAADMFAHTDTSYAPWYIISTNDKQQARIEVLRAILKQLKADRDTD